MSTENAGGTSGPERRRARSDLKELVKLAAEMREPVRPPVVSSARITIPPVSIPAPPIAARVSITVTQERGVSVAAKRGPWRSVVIGACVGISLSALGLCALVVRRDAMRASSGHAETSAIAASVAAVGSRATTLARAEDRPAPPDAAPDALPLAAPTKPESAAAPLFPRGSVAKPIAKPATAKIAAAPAVAPPPAAAPAKNDLVDLMRASVAGKPKPAP